jgi:hypothetical protein
MTESPSRSNKRTRLRRIVDFKPTHWPQTLRTRISQHRAANGLRLSRTAEAQKEGDVPRELFGAMTFVNIPSRRWRLWRRRRN